VDGTRVVQVVTGKAKEGAGLVVAVDRRQRGQAPPGRRAVLARAPKSASGNAKPGRRVMARGTFGIPVGVRDCPVGGTTIRTRHGREG
jgi:hypothetical protein